MLRASSSSAAAARTLRHCSKLKKRLPEQQQQRPSSSLLLSATRSTSRSSAVRHRHLPVNANVVGSTHHPPTLLRFGNQTRCFATTNELLTPSLSSITNYSYSSLSCGNEVALKARRQTLLANNGLRLNNFHYDWRGYNQQHQEQQQQRMFFSTKPAEKAAASSSSITSSVDSKDDEIKSEQVKVKSKLNSGPAASSETLIKESTPTNSATTINADKKTNTNNKEASSSTSSSSNSSTPSTKKASSTTSNIILTTLQSIITLLLKTPSILYFYLTHPIELKLKLSELKEHAVKEAHHYWMGSKLLAADVRTAQHILGRTLRGSTLSRRERKQLLRTVTDVFRLVPMSIFVLVPFMEFALPFAIKVFPNMLPSTFRDGLKEEEKMKRELQMRIRMAGFFQDTLTELAKEQKKVATEIRKHDNANAASNDSEETTTNIMSKEEASASSFLEFLKKARTGEAIPPNVIINFAKYFEDNLTLDNMGRMQLINLCKYMGIPPYGSNDLLRFYLRHKIRTLKDDDQRITWEGIESLTKMELREACRERGMRSTGLRKEAYRAALQQWLDLSVQKNVPISLLIMSRTFYLHDEMVGGESVDGSKGVTGLADAMSGIDKEVLNEIVLEMASSEEKSKNADVMKIQLEVLEHQNELIKEEQEERDAAAKEKEEKEKAKAADQDQAQDKVGEANGDESTTTKKEEAVEDNMAATTFSKDVGETTTASTTEFDSLASPIATEKDAEKVISDEDTTTMTSTEDEKKELSTEEIDAISQLASPDPVQKEREELQRIKDAMKAESTDEPSRETLEEQQLPEVDEERLRQQSADASLEMSSAISPTEPICTEEAQEEAVKSIKELEDAIEKEAKESNVISMNGDIADGKEKADEGGSSEEDTTASTEQEESVGDAKLQKAIDRLKSRVESMVGKIETRLTDVESKIGNKFHLLDKDGDGVLTMEEMARVLQTVLKRELTSEEANAIAADMDTNKDGVFSIAELAQWCETNTIVKLAEEGREKDLDELITERVQERRKLKEEDEEWTGM